MIRIAKTRSLDLRVALGATLAALTLSVAALPASAQSIGQPQRSPSVAQAVQQDAAPAPAIEQPAENSQVPTADVADVMPETAPADGKPAHDKVVKKVVPEKKIVHAPAPSYHRPVYVQRYAQPHYVKPHFVQPHYVKPHGYGHQGQAFHGHGHKQVYVYRSHGNSYGHKSYGHSFHGYRSH